MNRYVIGSLWDRDNRNGANKNFEYLFEGRQKIDELNYRAEGILTEAQRTNRLNNNTNSRLDNIIADSGTSSTEVVDARGDNTVLSGRFEENENMMEIEQLKSLKSNTNDSSGINIAPKKTKRPLITFIDDDGAESVYTRLKPIFDSRGVPCTIALVSEWIDKNDVGSYGKSLSTAQALELQENGWEIASHEKTHIHLESITNKNTLETELIQSKAELIRKGFDVKNLVYPYGASNSTARELAKNVYKVGVTANYPNNNETNTYPLDNFLLKRVALGSYAGDGKDTLAHHKSVIDKAISENSWVIFMTHVWAHGSTGDQLLADVIDYAQSKSVDIVNLDEGLETFGDKLNIDGLVRVTPNNEIVSDKIFAHYKNPLNGATPDTPITSFIENGITYTQINHNGQEGFPENRAGLLVTDRYASSVGFQRQEYKVSLKDNTYERAWGTNGWGEWYRRARILNKTYEHNFGSVPSQSSVNIEVPFEGVEVNDNILVDSQQPLPNSIILEARVKSKGLITIRLHNYKASDVNTYNTVFILCAIKRI